MTAVKEISSHFLYSSSIYTSRTPVTIQTVLGSCIAVCMFDTKTQMGGMNHYMLPTWNGEGLATAKYGNVAIMKLYEALLKEGAQPSKIIAKIFGGAEQLSGKSFFEVGKRNIAVAEALLNTLQIPIVASNVGGPVGRKIVFNTGSGQVLLKFVND